MRNFYLFSIIVFMLSFSAHSASAATPSISISSFPAEHLISEEGCGKVSFTNSSAGDGYGPYLFTTVPLNVAVSNVHFVDVSPTITTVGSIDASGQIADPISGAMLAGEPGGTAYLVRYPVGSVTQGQAPLDLGFCLTALPGAVINVPLPINILPGFEFGDTPTGDNGPITGSQGVATITPILARIKKTNTAPEAERTPGPDFPFNYVYSIDISDATTIDNVNLTDFLPPEIQWTGSAISVAAPLSVGCAVTNSPNLPTTTGGDLVIDCSSVTGTTSTADLTVTLEVYISDILDETIDDQQNIQNLVTFNYDYQGNSETQTDTSDVLAVHSAAQKSVSNDTPVPGETLVYTVQFQVTDYPNGIFQGANQFILTDIIPDGMLFVSTDSLVVNGNPIAITETQSGNTPGSGQTTVTWDIVAAKGNKLPTGAIGTLTYSVQVLEQYANGQPVLADDHLVNNLNLDYTLHAGGDGDNDSSAGVTIVPNETEKVLQAPSPAPGEFAAGDTLTFRISMDIPAGNTKNVQFIDYLPLPVIDVDTIPVPVVTIPPLPYLQITPTVTIDSAKNALIIDWGDITTNNPTSLAADITVVITSAPFADNLFLTNLFSSSYEDSDGNIIDSDPDAFGFNVGSPDLTITKGVFSIDNGKATISPAPPGSITADKVIGDVTNADAFDVVTFVINVENIGGKSADNVTITDPAVSGMVCAQPGDTDVLDGTGTPIAFSGDITTTGLVLKKPLTANNNNPAGGGAPFGTDTAIISLRCTLANDISYTQKIINTASVTWTSTADPGNVFPPKQDDAFIQTARPAIEKTIDTITPHYSSGNNVHIGEMVTYRVEVTIPEGINDVVQLIDLLDEGLAFAQLVSINGDAGLSTSIGTFTDVKNASTFTASGGGAQDLDSILTSTFGTISNSNSDNSTAEKITLIYETRTLNWTGNTNGFQRQNQVQWSWEKITGGRASATKRAPKVTLVEPELQITKIITPDKGDLTTIAHVSLRLQHAPGSTSDAFDVRLEDMIPDFAEITNLQVGVCNSAPSFGPDSNPALPSAGPHMITASWDSFQQSGDCTIEFDLQLLSLPQAGDIYHNCASTQWQSMENPLLTSPPDNLLAVERTGDTGDTGGVANTYYAQGCDNFTILDVDVNKITDSTSEPETDGISVAPGAEPLTIGEEITFLISATVPIASTGDLVITDQLPHTEAVLEYISFTYDPAAQGSDLTIPVNPPTFVVSDQFLGDGINDTIAFTFGNVLNNSVDGIIDDNDRIFIKVTARVKNINKNKNKHLDENLVLVRFGSDLSKTAIQKIELVEPLLIISKVADKTEMEGGDLVTYTLTITHSSASQSNAQQLNLHDILPLKMTLIASSVKLGATCTDIPEIGPSASGNSVTAYWDNFATGAICQIEFQAQADISAVSGQDIINTVFIDWDSLSPPSGKPDNRHYTDSSSWLVTISEPGLNKLLIATSVPETDFVPGTDLKGLTIGEEVIFIITASFPDGTTNNVVVQDLLPSSDVRLQIVSSQIKSIGSDLTLIPDHSVGDPGDDCAPHCSSNPDNIIDIALWHIGQVTNQPDTRPEPDTADIMTFEIKAIVLNNPQNSGALGDDNYLTNRALLTNNLTTLHANANFGLIEPLLNIDKRLSNGRDPWFTNSGQSETFIITIAHTAASTAAALKVRITDTLDSEMNWVNDNTVVSNCAGLVTDSSDSGNIKFSFPNLSYVQQKCTIQYEVLMSSPLPLPGVYSNTALMDWQSAPASSETRLGLAVDKATLLTLADGAITKEVMSTSLAETTGNKVTIGELVHYKIVAGIKEGTTNNVIVSDTVQADINGVLEIISANVIFVGRNLSAANPGTAVLSDTNGDGRNDHVDFDFGTVDNFPADSVHNADDTITIEVIARVINVTSNTQGDILGNEADLTFTSQLFPRTASADIVLVEPGLSLTKQFISLENDVAAINIRATNTGSAPVYDLNVTDEFDEIIWMPGSLQAISIPDGFSLHSSSSGGTSTIALRLDGDADHPTSQQIVMPGDSLEFTFSMQLVEPHTVNSILNIADAAGDSLPGIKTEQRTVNASGGDRLNLPALDVLKSWSGSNNPAIPGDMITYQINITNSGLVAASNLHLEDTPDAIGLFQGDAQITQGTGTILSGNVPGDTSIIVDFAAIGVNETLIVEYTVQVPSPYPAGAPDDQLVNQATLDSDELVQILSDDPATGSVDDPTIVPILADPDMVIDKTDHHLFALPGDTLRYYLPYGNAGDQNTTGVVITDTVPANTTFNSTASTVGWSCADGAASGTVCSFTIGALDGGQGAEIIFGLRVNDPLPAGVVQINNTAYITDDGNSSNDGQPSTDSGSDITPTFATPLFVITKDDGGISVVPGQAYSYAISFQNIGGQTATGVILSETVPDYTRFNQSAGSSAWICPNGSPAGTVCRISFPVLPPDIILATSFGLTVDNPMLSGTNFIDNTVIIADDGTNSLGIPITATDNDNTPVIASPDMALGKTDNNVTAYPGRPLIYTLSYSNVGTQNATGVRIAERVPAGSTFSSADSAPYAWSCADGSPAGTHCVLFIGAVKTGGSGSVPFAVRVDQPVDGRLSQIDNTAVITDDGSNGPDPTPDNNVAREVTPLPLPLKKIPTLTSFGLLFLIASILLLHYHSSRRKS